MQIAKRTHPNLKCLLVGKSAEIERAIREADPSGDTFIYVGAVPYDEVAQYFAATNVGLYPGDDSDFFRFASPIKVYEYSAAGKPVISSSVIEVERLGWLNVLIRDPTPESFAEGIQHALDDGVQEEAPSLGKPALVMRETTERPEGVTAGTCRLVGTDKKKMLSEAELLLNDSDEYQRRSSLSNPHGNGKTAGRIRKILEGSIG